MVFASRSRVNDEPGSAARHPRRRDIADHKRLLSMLGNKSPTRTRLYGSTTPRQTPLGNRRSETGIHRSGVLECPCSREFWNRQSVWLSSAWEVPPLMRRNVRTAQFTRAQVICRRGMRSEAHWLPEINPKCWICVTNSENKPSEYCVQRTSIALSIRPSRPCSQMSRGERAIRPNARSTIRRRVQARLPKPRPFAGQNRSAAYRGHGKQFIYALLLPPAFPRKPL
jgi:hypothetical protein